MKRQYIIDALADAIDNARADVTKDNDRWAKLATGQDSDESEYSGWLEGYVDGLATALDIILEAS